ncbi:MAG: hypothetical protein M3N98_16065, partial [Actinomycetota bacterium]|nr:hypothetical protein [Actinomycetota bacterium]
MPKAATIDRLGPEIPADLSGLDETALRALLDEALAADNPDAEITPAYADLLEAMIADVDRVNA